VSHSSLPAAATAAATQHTSDQIGPQQPFAGAVAGNQPAKPPQAPDPGSSQDSDLASLASDSSDSTHESPHGSAVPVGTLLAGTLLAALVIWLMNRR